MARDPGLAGWFESRPIATQIVVPLVINVISSIVMLVVVSSDAKLILLTVLSLVLSVLLIAGFVAIERLIGIVGLQAIPRPSGGPKETLVQEALHSMSRYGFIRNAGQVSIIRRRLETAEYVRGEHLLSVLSNKIRTCKTSLWAINDHPFSPFSSLVMEKVSPETDVRCINAKPDQLYSVDSVKRRLALAQRPKCQYFLLPDEDVHLSLVIFDKATAILYTAPLGHTVCNFF